MKMINPYLIDKQGICQDSVNALESLHQIRENIFDNLENMSTDDIVLHREEMVHLIESMEYKMQELWQFDQTDSMHTWWYRNPACTCPNMDNDGALGTPIRYTNKSCPLHGTP